MTTFELEIGKLMAQFDGLSGQISDVKRSLEKTNLQIEKLHVNWAGLQHELDQKYISRADLAPVKAVLSAVVLTTISALCVAFSELFLGQLF